MTSKAASSGEIRPGPCEHISKCLSLYEISDEMASKSEGQKLRHIPFVHFRGYCFALILSKLAFIKSEFNT